VLKFLFDFDLVRKNRELRSGGRFLQINPIIYRDARLELRHLDQGIANIAADAFEFSRSLSRGAPGPGFEAKKDEDANRCDDQHDKGERERPGKFSPSSRYL
jgi:hypothetical protein